MYKGCTDKNAIDYEGLNKGFSYIGTGYEDTDYLVRSGRYYKCYFSGHFSQLILEVLDEDAFDSDETVTLELLIRYNDLYNAWKNVSTVEIEDGTHTDESVWQRDYNKLFDVN
jgi:hypothetical protein